MRRRLRAPLLLLALCIGLGVLVQLQLRHERAAAHEPLTDIDPAGVHRFAVECRGCTPRRFERVAGHWQMRAPHDAPADEAAVARLLAIATAPVLRRHAAGALDPARIGLQPPQALLRLDDRELRFGATDAIDGDRYVDTGTAIVLVPEQYTALLFEPAEREIARAASTPAATP
ncbi:MAG: DUF4340 domain-containing protein [Dokdonella sp.]|uniref:DUF4340 domain-containing protein n=1 Tax=Dokdonella sp. TaxID=2291710 RepID=UPI0031BC2857|nr:DUF4340 domain-containing protein [Dokdonella sp.]